jgi:hypothetical protein
MVYLSNILTQLHHWTFKLELGYSYWFMDAAQTIQSCCIA